MENKSVIKDIKSMSTHSGKVGQSLSSPQIKNIFNEKLKPGTITFFFSQNKNLIDVE